MRNLCLLESRIKRPYYIYRYIIDNASSEGIEDVYSKKKRSKYRCTNISLTKTGIREDISFSHIDEGFYFLISTPIKFKYYINIKSSNLRIMQITHYVKT